MQRFIQSASSVHSTNPNDLNLHFLTINLTTVLTILLAMHFLPYFQYKPTYLSDHVISVLISNQFHLIPLSLSRSCCHISES